MAVIRPAAQNCRGRRQMMFFGGGRGRSNFNRLRRLTMGRHEGSIATSDEFMAATRVRRSTHFTNDAPQVDPPAVRRRFQHSGRNAERMLLMQAYCRASRGRVVWRGKLCSDKVRWYSEDPSSARRRRLARYQGAHHLRNINWLTLACHRRNHDCHSFARPAKIK